jgi:methyl-accepting chemotaxis protein
MRKSFFRIKYLTSSQIQLRFLNLLVISMVVPLIFVGGCLYYLIFTVMAEQIGIPEYVAQTLFPVIKKINLMIFVGIPPLFLALILWGIIASHRVAGPIERLQDELKKIIDQGDYSKRIRLRRRDDVRPIADSINTLLENIERKR